MNKIAVRTPYLTSEIQTSLSGTRASGAVAGTYAVMKLLGREGYRKMVKMCMGNTEYLQKGIKELGLELVLDPPPMNLIGVKVRKVEKVYIELARKGWMTSTAHNPHCIRLVVMPHMTRKSIDNFVAQFAKTCKKLKEI
jgi:tyrosine decarboxylase/aspartate 1-decarboxylase